MATWEAFASEDLLRQAVVERMLAGVATRRHVDVTEPVGVVGKATSKSAVSRRFAIDRRLAQAFAHPDPDAGVRAYEALARPLDGQHPDAAACLREGLEEMFTIAHLGVTGPLRRSLTNTTCIESMTRSLTPLRPA